jgi:cytoskeletal protein RodZ
MSYVRKMLGLGVLLLLISLAVFVPLALAYDTNNLETVNQPGAYVGMFQTTPTGTVTIEATDEATATTEPAATTEVTATVEPLATTEALTTATVEAGAAQATATPATTLPATGGEFTPWPMIALLVVGGLILLSGLGLALSRRSH